MNVYIIDTGQVIQPFGVRSAECKIGSITLRDWQHTILKKLRLDFQHIQRTERIADDDAYITINDSTFFTQALLEHFVQLTKPLKTKAVLRKRADLMAERCVISTQNIKREHEYCIYPVYYFPPKQHRNTEKTTCIDIYADCTYETISFPKHFIGVEEYQVPLSLELIGEVSHWSNVLALNVLTLLSGLLSLKKNKFRLLKAVLASRSVNKWDVLAKMNKIGKQCNIHPKAYIEGSTIGNHVTIGAGAIVRESIIGDHTHIGSGVVIEASVLGDHCSIINGKIMYSVVGNGFFSTTSYLATCLIGNNVFIGANVTLTDYRLDQKNVNVIKNNKRVDSGNRILGCCIGDEVYLGAGCIVAPGRAIENGQRILLKKNHIITCSKGDDSPSSSYEKL